MIGFALSSWEALIANRDISASFREAGTEVTMVSRLFLGELTSQWDRASSKDHSSGGMNVVYCPL
jgi:hypothetical protein